MTVLRNRDRVLVTRENVAHRPAPVGPHTACGAARNEPMLSASFVQAYVYLKPSWCLSPVCFPGGAS